MFDYWTVNSFALVLLFMRESSLIPRPSVGLGMRLVQELIHVADWLSAITKPSASRDCTIISLCGVNV